MKCCEYDEFRLLLCHTKHIKKHTFMKIFNVLAAALFVATACSSCGNPAPKAEESALPKVYMTTDISPEGLVKVYEALGREATGRVAVKISTGEPGGKTTSNPN